MKANLTLNPSMQRTVSSQLCRLLTADNIFR